MMQQTTSKAGPARLAVVVMAWLLAGCSPSAGDTGELQVHSVTPPSGTIAGGEEITIRGLGFGQGTKVYFGDLPAEVTSRSATEIQVISPAVSRGGAVDLTVVRGSAIQTKGRGFTYHGAPLLFVDRTLEQLEGAHAMRGWGAAFADLDGDGDLDLVQAHNNESVRVLLNDGSGTLSPVPGAVSGDSTSLVRDVLAADFTGDGVVDLLLVTSTTSPNKLLVGAGDGTFTWAPEALPDERRHSMSGEAVDVDLDGDLDVVLVHRPSSDPELEARVEVLINDGGVFTDEAPQRLADETLAAEAVRVAAADLDGNGAPDLFFSGNHGPNRLYWNDGAGRFAEAAPGTLPDLSDPQARKAAFGDVDGDGSLDIYLPSVGQDRLYLNNGAGQFHDYTTLLLGADDEYGHTAAFGDLDGDGCVDLAVAKYGGQLRIYRNDCTGRLYDYASTVQPTGRDPSRIITVLLGDVDGDGDLDLYTNPEHNRRPQLLINWYPEPMGDTDGDLVPDGADVCPDVPNPDQANRDAHHFSCIDGADCTDRTGCSLAVRRGESAYLLCDATLTWAEARAFCQELGADLVVVESEEEHTWLAERGLADPWIGLTDQAAEGSFQWTDDSPLTFEAWGENQPDNYGDGEHCVHLRSSAADWNDLSCDAAMPFVCEDVVVRLPADPADACDNCPAVYNPDQADSDGNGVGDACEQ